MSRLAPGAHTPSRRSGGERSAAWLGRAGLMYFVIAAFASPAAAQPPGAPGGPPATVQTGQPDPSTQIDIPDVIRMLRRKPPPAPAPDGEQRGMMLAITPTLGSKPSSGLIVGVLANAAFYRGDPADTGISSATLRLQVTTKKQALVTGLLNMFTSRDRFIIQGDNRFHWTSEDTFGLGPGTQPSDAFNVRFDHVRVSDAVYVAIWRDVYAGGGLHLNSHFHIRSGEDAESGWDDSAYVEYSNRYGFPLDGQTSNALSFGVLLDTRDNSINASRGWLAAATFRPYATWLGSTSAWQEALLDVRTYRPLTGDARHRIAVWLYGDLVVDGVAPYFDLPSTGADVHGRSGRGYAQGRFRGDRLAYAEVEYRGALTRNGLLGTVAFLNLSTVSDRSTGQSLFDEFAPGAGVGLRVLFNKHSKTNFCMDVGWGRGSWGVYLGLQEAF
jgi:hypothetical protein